MQRHHPDVAGDDPNATGRAAELTAAYRRLTTPQSAPRPAAPPDPPPGRDDPPHAQVRADGVLIVEAPGNETFLRVLEALETIGDVTYRDRSGGYLQAIIQPADGPLCTMVVAVEPRAVDTVVSVSLDSMDGNPAPSVDAILHELATLVASD